MVGRRPYLQAGLLLANLSIVAGPCGPGLAAERSAIVTLEAAAREAVAWHPSITQAVGALGARDAEVDAARAGYRPTVSAGLASGYDNRISGTWRPRPQVAASQMLYDFGKVASDVAAARAGTQIGRAGVLLSVDTLIRDTGYALIEVQRAAALRRVAEDQAASVAQIGDLVGRRATMGAATQSDALQAQARVEAATASLSQIAAEERRWTSNLGYLLGRDAPPAGVSPSVPAWLLHSCSGPLPDTQSVPAVMAADAEAVRAAAYVRRSRADRYPTLSIGGDASTDIASPFGSRGIYNVGLRVSSNVFAGGLVKARVRGAGFELDAAEANARRVRNETGQRLAEAQAQIDSLSQLVVTLGAREINMRETGRLYRIQYLEMGTRTLVDLLNAEQELQQVRFEAVNTAHDLRRLEIDCLFLTGRMRDAFGLAGTSVRGGGAVTTPVPKTLAGTTPAPSVPAAIDDWLELLARVARHYRLPVSEQRARLAAQWDLGDGEEARVRTLARAAGLSVAFTPPEAMRLTSWRLPVIVVLGDGEIALVEGIDADGAVRMTLPGDRGGQTRISIDTLVAGATRYVVPRPARSAPDMRVDTYIRPYEEHWLRRILLRDARSYGHVIVASVVTNCLGLAGVLFSMQVYDRVVPAGSIPTLTILFVGVLVAIGFEFLLRRLRIDIVDVIGKRADLRISDRVFGHALRVRNQARPASTGTFIAQLRDLDQVRDLLTSTTVATVADLPFFLLFLGLLFFIGGVLALVPLVALILLLLPGLLAQRRLRRLATESMRESSLRNAMLVEAVQGIEDIKALQAEDRFQHQWNHYNAVAGEAQLRLRGLTNGLTGWTQSVQNGVYAAIIFVGAPLVIAGEITTGVLVATSILGSRMMAPMAQVTQLLGRLQHARVAMGSLNQIMALPVDTADADHRIPLPCVAGAFAIRAGVFGYADPDAPPALRIARLDIAAGERIAVLGRNGAGKSTLLQALSGMLQPVSGEVLLDGLALHQVDPADVRRDIGLLTQTSRLFHGTLRENLTLGAPTAADADIARMLAMVGADAMVRGLRDGLNHVVQEGGRGLSGGQVQALLLARLLLRQPVVALLDEPTAAMDEGTERHFIQRLGEWSRDRTVIVATHRMRMLDMVDRVIVIDRGGIVLDGPKDEILRTMRDGAKVAA